jgi:hypothetical protein
LDRGNVVGVELFDAASMLRSSLRRLVGSYALDALESGQPAFGTPSAAAVRIFLDGATTASTEEMPAVGLGSEVRAAGAEIVGEADGRLVHLSALLRGREGLGG